MLATLSVLIGLTAFSVFIAGLLAFARNPNRHQNQWFFVFTSLLAIWLPINFYDSNVVAETWTVIALELDFAIALFMAWSFVQFVESLKEEYVAKSKIRSASSKHYKLFIRFGLALNILLLPVILSGRLVSSSIENGKLEVEYASIFYLYALLLCTYFVYGMARLNYFRRHALRNRQQAINLIFQGLLIAITTNLLTNLVFPSFITNRSIVQGLNVLGYLGIISFVLLVYIAITRQKLFDIRAVVARSIAYAFSIVVISILYTSIAYGFVSQFIFTDSTSDNVERAVYTILAVILAFTLRPIQAFFNRFTNRMFFRDAYDPQQLLEEYNQLLVSTYQLDPLLKGSLETLDNALKPISSMFVISPTEHVTGRVVGNQHHVSSDKELGQLQTLLSAYPSTLISSENLDANDDKLKRFFQKNRIDLVARLKPAEETDDIGFLILGAKKTGTLYSGQDQRIIQIIANELAIAVQNALRFEEISNFNITLQQKINAATQNLKRANQKLKELDEAKDDFISMASHQLRTPLTSVKGYISMIKEGDAGKVTPQQKQMLEQAFFSSQRMVYLIADLLNVSRLRTGKFVIEAGPVDLAKVVGEEIGQLMDIAKTRNLTLVYEQPKDSKDFTKLMLDETKTRQIIMNFVDNAIYYTPNGGHITVKLIENPSTIELKVVDDGIGVPKSEQPHLFTKFYRAGNARKARPDGTGLGLFMAKKVIITQHGALIFESKEGKGSTFGFSFSKSKLAVPDKLPAKTLAK